MENLPKKTNKSLDNFIEKLPSEFEKVFCNDISSKMETSYSDSFGKFLGNDAFVLIGSEEYLKNIFEKKKQEALEKKENPKIFVLEKVLEKTQQPFCIVKELDSGEEMRWLRRFAEEIENKEDINFLDNIVFPRDFIEFPNVREVKEEIRGLVGKFSTSGTLSRDDRKSLSEKLKTLSVFKISGLLINKTAEELASPSKKTKGKNPKV